MKAGFYEPFPAAAIDCTKITPAATCERLDPYQIQLTLSGTADNVSGDIGPMKNPFSSIPLTLIQVRYYSAANGGCATSTSTSSTSTLNPAGF